MLLFFFIAKDCIKAESKQFKSISLSDFMVFSIFFIDIKKFSLFIFVLCLIIEVSTSKFFGPFYIYWIFSHFKCRIVWIESKDFFINVCSISLLIVLIQAKSLYFYNYIYIFFNKTYFTNLANLFCLAFWFIVTNSFLIQSCSNV